MRQQSESERDRLLSNGRLGGSASLGGFFQQKFDELKGVNQEQAKAEKIKAVEEKIESVGVILLSSSCARIVVLPVNKFC